MTGLFRLWRLEALPLKIVAENDGSFAAQQKKVARKNLSLFQ